MESIMVMRNHVIDFTPTWFFWYLFATWSVWLWYAEDKEAAEEQQRRIPEKYLLTGTLIAPIGAWLGMNCCRHKIRKQIFWNVLYISFVLHVVLFIYAKGEEWI
uniref:DUF1294 domain-containing protein n=1 Tax=Cacopsylla melanoneura TaxID=428564 RepID=A0A8D8SX37_9HEMI